MDVGLILELPVVKGSQLLLLNLEQFKLAGHSEVMLMLELAVLESIQLLSVRAVQVRKTFGGHADLGVTSRKATSAIAEPRAVQVVRTLRGHAHPRAARLGGQLLNNRAEGQAAIAEQHS